MTTLVASPAATLPSLPPRGKTGLNLFYWPLWLAAEDKSIRNTYANCARFWLLHPVAALVLFAVCLVAALLLMPFALPIVLGVVFWIALVAETAVRQSLEGVTAGRSE